MNSRSDILKKRIPVARGLKKADLVLKGGRIVNVRSGEIYEADVAVFQGKIAGLGAYTGKREIRVQGRFILPGFIDSHVHLESSMLTPAEFTKAALPHGTTAVVADPHEIANVLGKKGIQYVLNTTEGLPLAFYFMLPSCVPATTLETSGARLTSSQLKPFLANKRVLGLAEVMTYPAVLSADRQVLSKLEDFQDTIIDGHAPGLTGKDLSAYAAAGISSDHECTTAEEAKEKVRLGITIYIREGSAAKDLETLLPAVTIANSRFFTLASDDLQPGDLRHGSINLIVRKAIRLGLDPMTAVRMATINPALHFGLRHKGAVLPGYDADMLVVDNLDDLRVEMVFTSGRLVAEHGRMVSQVRSVSHAPARNSVRMKPAIRDRLRIPARSGRIRVIELIPNQIETRHSVFPALVRNGVAVSDPSRDILKLVVAERHRATGNIGRGFVKGFGLSSGALASSVAHDSHNLICVGVDDDDILLALRRIKKLQGGLVVVDRGRIIAEFPLPVAGLMSNRTREYAAEKLSAIEKAVTGLGVQLERPFSTLSFLALPVVPELKLTDRGLVDVNAFRLVDLFL